MVDRYEINAIRPRDPVTVVDLDGTYLNGNTLKIYFQCGIKFLITKGQLPKAVTLMAYAIARRLRLITHIKLKKEILDILFPYPEILPKFRKTALKKVNPKVAALINRNYQAGHKILLATAAPSFYVKEIWSGDNIIATEYSLGDLDLIECKGNEKLRRVNEWISLHYCILDTVVSDHYDDAPLFAANTCSAAEANILVNPNRKTLRFFRELQPTHFLLIEEIADLSITS